MRERKILIISVLTGLLVWIIDTLIDPALYDTPFMAVLLYGSSPHEFLMRVTILVSFIVFGLIASGIFKKRIDAEKALSEKSVYLDNILRSATEFAIATTDKDLRITYYNPMAEKLHGYKASDIVGKTVMEVHTREKVSTERFRAAMEEVKKKGDHVYMLHRETPAGTRLIEARVSGIFDYSGELVGFANFSRDVTDIKKAEAERDRLITELQEALQHVKTLSGLLPICSYCKKIRDDGGYWNQIETYIRKHSTAEFTHSICPECEQKELANLEKELLKK